MKDSYDIFIEVKRSFHITYTWRQYNIFITEWDAISNSIAE